MAMRVLFNTIIFFLIRAAVMLRILSFYIVDFEDFYEINLLIILIISYYSFLYGHLLDEENQDYLIADNLDYILYFREILVIILIFLLEIMIKNVFAVTVTKVYICFGFIAFILLARNSVTKMEIGRLLNITVFLAMFMITKETKIDLLAAITTLLLWLGFFFRYIVNFSLLQSRYLSFGKSVSVMLSFFSLRLLVSLLRLRENYFIVRMFYSLITIMLPYVMFTIVGAETLGIVFLVVELHIIIVVIEIYQMLVLDIDYIMFVVLRLKKKEQSILEKNLDFLIKNEKDKRVNLMGLYCYYYCYTYIDNLEEAKKNVYDKRDRLNLIIEMEITASKLRLERQFMGSHLNSSYFQILIVFSPGIASFILRNSGIF